MKLIIGVIGENGAGKGTFSDLVIANCRNLKIIKVKFSDVLLKTLKMWGLPATRSNLQNLALIMNKQYGEGTLTRATAELIRVKKADVVIVEGVRLDSDVPMVRSFKRNVLVFVTAKPKIRYERMSKRGEKIGEKNFTYTQFLKEEKVGTEIYIKKIGKLADVRIENNGELSDMIQKVKQFCKKYIFLLA